MLEFRFVYGDIGYELTKDMREKIFSEEMGYSVTSDDYDTESYHFVGYEKTSQISVARLTKLDDENYKISYVGIKPEYRRQYVGDLIVRALADKAARLGGVSLIAEVPSDVKEFFKFEDYEEYGNEFDFCGMPHIMMKKDLLKPQKCRGCAK